MEVFKIWFKQLEEAHPDLYHDEIDCALAWAASMKMILSWLQCQHSCGELEALKSQLTAELRPNRKKI